MGRCTAVIVALLASTVAGCSSGVFACGDDSDCAGEADGGVCEASGFCSFIDEACDSGRRYGSHAGDGLAGTCVELGETTSGSSTSPSTTLTSTTQSSTVTTLTTDPTTSTSSVDSDDTQPVADSSSTTGVDQCPPGWWDCAWSHRLELALAPIAVRVPAPIPVAVTLTPDRWDATTAQMQGEDLRFVDSTGAMVPHELESTGATTVAWILWPAIAPTTVSVYWGNPDAVDGQTPAAVWQDGHEAVWHMADGGDSLGLHTLGEFGTEPVLGHIAQASSFTGNSYMQGDAGDSLGTLFAGPATIEAWVYLESYGPEGRGRIIDNAIDNQPDIGWTFQVRETMPVQAIQFELGHAGTEAGWSTANVLDTGQWQHLAVVHEDGGVALYVDGVAQTVSSFPGVGPIALDTDVPITLGRVSNQLTGFFDGVIDEVRLSSVARTPAWIATQYVSGNDGLLLYGAVEQQAE